MKKFILIISVVGFSLCASAQLEVNSRGQVFAGKSYKSPLEPGLPVFPSMPSVTE